MDINEQRDYISSISNHTDRELIELQTYYARKQSDYLRSVRSSLNFFYILTILSIIVYGIYLYNVSEKAKQFEDKLILESVH